MANPIIINKIPAKVSPSNPNLPILVGKLDTNNQIEIDDAVDLALVKVQDALNGVGGSIEGASVGASGLSIYKAKAGNILQFKKLSNTSGISIAEANDVISLGLDKVAAGLDKVPNKTEVELVTTGAIKSALDTKPTLNAGKIDSSVIPTSVVQVDGTGKISAALLPDGINNAEIVFFTQPANTPPATVGVADTLYINRTDGKQYRYDSGAYIVVGGGSGGGAISITNGVGVTTTSSSFIINKAFVDLANVDNTSDANKPISTATQTALNTKIAKTDISAAAGNSQFTYNNTTGVFSSGFNDTLKTAYDDANSKKHVHTDINALNNITQAKLNEYGLVRVKSEIIDLTPNILTINQGGVAGQTRWTHNPLKPNVFLVISANTQLTPVDLINGSWGNVETIQDGTGNWVVTFAGVAPASDDYPVVVDTAVQIQAYAKYNFDWYRNSIDLMWESTHTGIGSQIIFVPTPASLTHVDNATNITLTWAASTNASKYFLQRRTYITSTKVSSWYYIWTPGNTDPARANLSYVDTEVEKGVKYEYRVQGIDQSNSRYPSDWRVIAAPVTKA